MASFHMFAYLEYLFILVLASYFAAHGKTIGAPQFGSAHPLRLPRGTVRWLLLLGFAGLIGWLFYHGGDFRKRLEVPVYMPLVLLAGFILGHLICRMVRGMTSDNNEPPLFQDILAWLSLIAVLIFGVVFLIGFINISLPTELQVEFPKLEAVLAAVVGFYFGAKS